MLQKSFDNNVEQKWQKRWQEENTYAFAPESGKPLYTLDTPPPFTSGELHMGHALSYAYFDFVARYKRMNGFNVFYPQGWDTQGFPTEVKVEKKFGRLPPPEFRKKCMEWTEGMIAKMKESMVGMGYSPDWSYQYRTMDPEYHRKVQLSLLQMHKKKMVYRAKHPVYWCTRCRSALAKTDTEDVERTTQLNYFTFTGPEGEPLEIATTRPELMPACVAVMFHPEDDRYRHLAGKKIKTALGREVPAIADKDVLKDFGTGLLMVCTFGDKMDVIWSYRHKLPVIEAIGTDGKMKNTGLFDGMKVGEAKKAIIEMLREKGKLARQEEIGRRSVNALSPSMERIGRVGFPSGFGFDVTDTATLLLRAVEAPGKRAEYCTSRINGRAKTRLFATFRKLLEYMCTDPDVGEFDAAGRLGKQGIMIRARKIAIAAIPRSGGVYSEHCGTYCLDCGIGLGRIMMLNNSPGTVREIIRMEALSSGRGAGEKDSMMRKWRRELRMASYDDY